MIRFYRVTPVSVMFFRDPRPFTAGEQALARLQFPPRLTPFLGALRTKYLEKKAEGKPIPQLFPDIEGELKGISAIWFSMFKDNVPILPLPCDIFVKWKSLFGERFVYEKPTDDDNPLSVPVLKLQNMVKSLFSGDLENGKGKFAPPQYITLKGFLQYQSGSLPESSDLLPTNSLWEFENRVGIGLKPGAKIVERSKFYRMTVARPLPGVGFLVGAVFPDNADIPEIFDGTFTTRLGGEGHIAVWEKIDWIKGAQSSGKFRKIVSLSHIPIKRGGKARLDITNWCINKLDIISGWDYKERRPKPLVKALRPGTVLSVKLLNGSKPSKVYKISFGNYASILIIKDLVISMKDEKPHLVDFEPELGEPNTLFVIKN